ncbi:MAG TPA: glucan biosynthesis protein D [Caulobacteraceae bacterium]|nr:glucan biosynthesis protein D [Caulobacteraceae bacterium]
MRHRTDILSPRYAASSTDPGQPSRRALMALLASALAAPSVASAAAWPNEARLGPPRPFTFEQLKSEALSRARQPYRPPPSPPPSLVRAIDYDAFGQIVYRPQATLWGDEPGDHGVRFFPIGRPAGTPVAMHVVSGGQARALPYAEALFDMPADNPARKLGDGSGFAGFKVLNADHRTDWIAYLGASYFRSSDPFNQYGLSARGLALDTATPKAEEFPLFTAFWLEHDAGDGLVVYALLDGPSVAGAYRIGHRRSPAGLVQDIEAELHFRRPVERLGVAPLTSMYWYGQSDRTPTDDWRPQIHDSDGLSIWTGAGERLWRPLANPPVVKVNAFMDRGPKGFGLMQRDRNFEDYQDDGVFYDRRPSAWVEPVGDWGPGAVQLVELPTTGEADDNIVAFWVPAAPVTAGTTLRPRYRLHWSKEEPATPGVARVVATRSGQGGRPGQPIPPGRRKTVIDFAGPGLAGLTRQSGVTPVVTLSAGKPIEPGAYPVEGQDRWRLMFDYEAPPKTTLDLRAQLARAGRVLTETWLYQVITG